MARLLLLLALLAGLVWLARWFVRQPPQRAASWLRRGGLVLVLLVLGGLAASGRLSPLVAALGAIASVAVRYLPLIGRVAPVLARAGARRGLRPTLRGRHVTLWIDLATGAVAGEITAGEHAGQPLDALDTDTLRTLAQRLRASDPQSAALLAGYLALRRGAEPSAGAAAPPTGPMTRDEAWEVLGLEPGADEAAIIAAHRRLMQRLHPDRGGSGYLAARVNQARDVLLGA